MTDNYWPDPLELIDMQEAVQAGQEIAIIGDRKFRIRYDEKTFYVAPVDGFAPVGHFEYDHAFDEIVKREDT